jgi:hypothetical protein
MSIPIAIGRLKMKMSNTRELARAHAGETALIFFRDSIEDRKKHGKD